MELVRWVGIVTLKKKILVLHIGLPKTATTTLQNRFFPKYSAYAGKRVGWASESDAEVSLIKSSQTYLVFERFKETYLQFSGYAPQSRSGWREDLRRSVDELVFDESGLLIFSEEMLSRWFRGSSGDQAVDHEHPTPSGTHPITIFLSELRLMLPQDITLTSIVTLRNQSDFLGSSAAQHGRGEYFESRGFDRLVTEGDSFLDFNEFVCDLENVSGAQNHLTLLFEDGLETNISKIIDFIGPPDRDNEFDPGGERAAENVRQSGANRWAFQKARLPIARKINGSAASGVLRRSKWWPLFRPLFRPLFHLLRNIQKASEIPMTVEISDADRLRIRAICRRSNELLAAHLERNLVDLGY